MEIKGKYKINDSAVFGTGTWAIVKECTPINDYIPIPYRSSPSKIPRLVAKVIDKQKLKEIVKDEQNGQAIVQRELNILETLPAHPGVVRFVESIETDSHFFLIFEAAIFGDLCELLLKSPTQKVEESTAQKYVVEMIHGLLHCHRHNVVHRDVKPENILVAEGNVLKIADFGLAKTSNGGPAMNVMTGVVGTASSNNNNINNNRESSPPSNEPFSGSGNQQTSAKLSPFTSTVEQQNSYHNSCNSNNMLQFLYPNRIFPKGTSLQTVMIEHRLRKASSKSSNSLPNSASLASSLDVAVIPSMLPPAPTCQGHEIMGTFRYGAPEMFDAKFSNSSFDAFQADAWSLGVVTFIMLTGTFPFSAGSNADERQTWKVLRESTLALPVLREQGGETSSEACDFLAKLLDKDPQRRMRLWDAFEHPWLAAEVRRQQYLARDSFVLPPKVKSLADVSGSSSSSSSSGTNAQNTHVVTLFADSSSPHFVSACQELYPLSPALEYMRKMITGDSSNNIENLKSVYNQLVIDHYQKFDALSRLRQSVSFGMPEMIKQQVQQNHHLYRDLILSASGGDNNTNNENNNNSNSSGNNNHYPPMSGNNNNNASSANRAQTPGTIRGTARNTIRTGSPIRTNNNNLPPNTNTNTTAASPTNNNVSGGRTSQSNANNNNNNGSGMLLNSARGTARTPVSTNNNARQSPSAGSLRGSSQQSASQQQQQQNTIPGRTTHASPISRFGAGAVRRATPTPGARTATPTTTTNNNNRSMNAATGNTTPNANNQRSTTPGGGGTATTVRRASPLPSARGTTPGTRTGIQQQNSNGGGASSTQQQQQQQNNNNSSSAGAVAPNVAIGDAVSYKSAKAVVKFVGATKFAPGLWLGLELVGDGEGLHDGTSSIDKKRYFTCPPGKGVFVRPSQIGKMDE